MLSQMTAILAFVSLLYNQSATFIAHLSFAVFASRVVNISTLSATLLVKCRKKINSLNAKISMPTGI